jgi:hypothetical protein
MDDSTAKFGMFFLKAPANSADLLPNDDLVRQLREQGKGGQSHAAPRSGLLGMIDEVRRMAEPFVPGGQAAAISDQDKVHPDDLILDNTMLVNPDDPTNPDKLSPPPGVPHVQSAPSVGGAGNVPPVPTFATTRPVAPDPAPPVPPAATVRSESSIFGGDPTKASPIWQGPPAAPATPASTVAAVAQKKLAWRLLNLRTMAFAVPLVVLLVVMVGVFIYTKDNQYQSTAVVAPLPAEPRLVGAADKLANGLHQHVEGVVAQRTADLRAKVAAQQEQINVLTNQTAQLQAQLNEVSSNNAALQRQTIDSAEVLRRLQELGGYVPPGS